MTTKSTIPKPVDGPTNVPDELKYAYQVHTLAQMLFTQLSGLPGWTPMVQPPFLPVLH